MRRAWRFHWLGVFIAAGIATGLAWAETLEMVTYYPAPAATSEDLHVRSLTVGTDYANETPENGDALVAGFLGIGTTQPKRPLHIVGEGKGADDSSMARIIIENSLGNGFFLNTFSDRDKFSIGRMKTPALPAGGDDITIAGGTGNVGIGEGSSLTRRLQVNNETGQASLGLSGASDAGETYSAIYLDDRSDDLTNSWVIAHRKRAGQPEQNSLLFGYWLDPATLRLPMTILPSGLVGIGKTNPVSQLEVAGDIQSTEPAGAGLARVGLYTGNDPQGGGDWNLYSIGGTHTLDRRLGGFEIQDNSTVGAPVMALSIQKTTANVGIGLTPPLNGIAGPPNGAGGNLDVNDIWLRSANGGAGRWMSAVAGGAGGGGYDGVEVGSTSVGGSSATGVISFGTFTAAGATRMRFTYTGPGGGANQMPSNSYTLIFRDAGGATLFTFEEGPDHNTVKRSHVFEIPRRAANMRFTKSAGTFDVRFLR